MSIHVGYGVLPGILYALFRGRPATHRRYWKARQSARSFIWLAILAGFRLLGLTRPTWKQPLPEIVGETMRHVAYGVTTAAIYEAIHGPA